MHAYAIYPTQPKTPTWAIVTLATLGATLLGLFAVVLVVVLREPGAQAYSLPPAASAPASPDVTPLSPVAAATPAVDEAPPFDDQPAPARRLRHKTRAHHTVAARAKAKRPTVVASRASKPGKKGHKKDELDRLLGL